MLNEIARSITLPHGIQAYTAGEGSTIVLLPGWPQTADAFLEVFQYLSKQYQVWTIDPPGLGYSAPSPTGYDAESISQILHKAVINAIPHPFHLVGHDVGAWIAYAYAAQFPESVKSLTVLDAAISAKTSFLPFPLPDAANLKLWQFSFNRLPDLPEALTQGRERIFLDWLFDHKAVHPERITEAKRMIYAEAYSRDGAMSRGFAYYRAHTVSARQYAKFAEDKLKMPVLCIGGDAGVGGNLKATMEAIAEDVSGGVIEDCGHFIMEEQPNIVAKMLLEFVEKVDGA